MSKSCVYVYFVVETVITITPIWGWVFCTNHKPYVLNFSI